MHTRNFSGELDIYGPGCRSAPAMTLRQAQAYCRHLARTHYENFTVASWLLPGHLRRHFYNVYAYCRWSDDLADETSGPAESLKLLDWWEGELEACYADKTRHPVFMALHDTIREFDIPRQPFEELLSACRQDQHQTRYATFEELLGYCRYSANPVGHLVLQLGGCHNATQVGWSDSICTGLQLANFWQDVSNDYDRGRIYLPQDSCRRFGFGEDDFRRRTSTDSFRAMMQFEVERAERLLCEGLPLLPHVPNWLRVDVELFIGGGLAILAAIRRQGYDVWSKRPTVGKLEKLQLIVDVWWRKRRHGSQATATS